MSHNHSHDDHSHGHSDHDHSHTHDPPTIPAEHSNLYTQIDFDKITTLNEREPGSGKAVVKKSWNERLDERPELISDVDEQILMVVPFTSLVTLHTLLLHFPPILSSPAKISLFRNRPDLDFSTATDLPPTQSFHLPVPSGAGAGAAPAPSASGVTELPLNRALWNGTTGVTVFVETNHYSDGGAGDGDGDGDGNADGEEEETTISYVGFRGNWMKLNREPVSVLYEAAPNPADHAVIQGLGVGVQGGVGRGR